MIPKSGLQIIPAIVVAAEVLAGPPVEVVAVVAVEGIECNVLERAIKYKGAQDKHFR